MINHKITALYQEKLTLLSVNFKEKTVATSFGKTNVIVFGDNTKPPFLLVHGLNSAAPFAFDVVSFLINKYQVFAVDILGQPNKSEFVRLSKKDDSYGKWLLEIIDYFKFKEVVVCGISFGAFPILKSLLIDEASIKKVYLIAPAGIINGNLWKTIFRFFIPIKQFQKTKNEAYLKKCLKQLYGSFDDVTFNYQKEVFLNFPMDFSITPNFKLSELKKITTPITSIASKNDFLVPAKKLKKKIKKCFKMNHKFVVLEHSKHIPTKQEIETFFKNS